MRWECPNGVISIQIDSFQSRFFGQFWMKSFYMLQRHQNFTIYEKFIWLPDIGTYMALALMWDTLFALTSLLTPLPIVWVHQLPWWLFGLQRHLINLSDVKVKFLNMRSTKFLLKQLLCHWQLYICTLQKQITHTSDLGVLS